MSTLAPVGWDWFTTTGAGSFWPAPTNGAGQGAAAGSPTGQRDLDPGGGTQNVSPRVLLGGILPLKKIANGSITLDIRKGDGTTTYGPILDFRADAVNFIGKSINFSDGDAGGLELDSGLSVVSSSADMLFLVWYKLVKSNYVADPYNPGKGVKSP